MALTRTHAPARRKPAAKTKRGTGAGEYTVQHVRANAKQRETIDGVLEQAQEDGASRRVMIATIMAITQESGAGKLANVMTGNDDVGIFQQGRPWISVEGSKDPAQSTHAFLTKPGMGWRAMHGSVKKAPGNLSLAIHKVQRNRDPMAYAPWEDEATKTVETWLDNGGSSGGGSYPKRYTFTRGEKGGSRENSWDAAQRLVEEVSAHRWAAGNTFYAVSDEELRAAGPSMMIYGDEGWLRVGPAWSWAAGRAITEITLEVIADRWDVMPGACVSLHRRFGAMQGKWLVWNVAAESLTSPEVTIVLRRPTRLKSEPAHEVGSRNDEGGGGDGSLYDACKEISDEGHSYPRPDRHHGAFKNFTRKTDLDCSESVSYALHKAGLFGDRKQAIVSGDFNQWGKPGKGDEWTVYYNGGHVFIQSEGDGDKWRFDTGGHPGVSGPRVVRSHRDTSRFATRRHPSH